MTMQAGRLNRKITIQRKGESADELGYPVPGVDAWIDVDTLWADVRAPSGLGQIAGEFQAGGTEVSRVQYSMRIRYRPSVEAGMRAVLRGVPFEIRQVIHDEAGRKHTDLVCATGANEG